LQRHQHWRDSLSSSNMISVMKRGPFLVVILLAAAATAVAAGVAIFHGGLSARAVPSRLEAMMASRARHLSIPSDARHATNPITLTPQSLREGRLHFADHCSVCHANDGGGQTMFGLGLYPKPSDLRSAETQKLSDGELFWIIENGVRFTGMPAFSGHGGAEEDSWRLVLFIRHLPKLAPEELAEMERYNPKGVEDRLEEQQEDDFLNGRGNSSDSAKPGKSTPKQRP
jgi:mono/diheme cytochrome c family protein